MAIVIIIVVILTVVICILSAVVAVVAVSSSSSCSSFFFVFAVLVCILDIRVREHSRDGRGPVEAVDPEITSVLVVVFSSGCVERVGSV